MYECLAAEELQQQETSNERLYTDEFEESLEEHYGSAMYWSDGIISVVDKE
jgi:hypothetical protein